jgi:hypothetical protein
MVALLPNHSKSKVLDYHVDESLSFLWSVNKILLMFLLYPYFIKKNRFPKRAKVDVLFFLWQFNHTPPPWLALP